MVVFMATGLEWVWVGRSAGAGWFDSGDGHNSYCRSIGCRGHGVHDYVVVVEMAALTELAVIVLTVAMEPARLMAVGVG